MTSVTADSNNCNDLAELIDEHADGYAGDIAPDQAYDYLAAHKDAVFVDLRTKPEWQFVGMANLQDIGHEVHLISWLNYPDGLSNSQFTEQLGQIASDTSTPIFFICRSGRRSLAASKFATSHGYQYAFNIDEGFEGKLDGSGQRGRRNGWKSAKLPWSQT